ncbi:UV-B-induced protein-like, chloroplastic [Iris pallida]|uniref:UV-B-induced protein-like, chloroplastic n=1 Tax=Iris pallida TaxID=29817 RepID=A0AAX6H633_IRIPA|nr:UV-B-induced protein-like, chloroplastic [Iris pallida]
MEAYVALGSAPVSCKFSGFGSRSCVPSPAHRPNLFAGDSKRVLSSRPLSGYCSTSLSKRGHRRSAVIYSKRNFRTRASLSSSPSNSSESSSIAPLRLESPIGQFLSQILLNNPHLLPAAVDQQLQQLQIDREAEKEKEEAASTGTELVLYKRIAEVKATERKRALEEILYALAVQRFVEVDVPLVPSLSALTDPSGRVDVTPSGEDKLQRLHSSEAFEMIKSHLSLILGQRSDDGSSIGPISKLRIGQVYAASIMYGYFLRRVDQRFQLDKSMKTLPWGSEDQDTGIKQSIPDESRPYVGKPHPEGLSWSSPGASESDGFADRLKQCTLRTYVMSFDADTLQRYAAIRSKEAFSIIEKHTEALFGRPEIVITPQGTIDPSKDELIKINFGGLKRLVLEAVTFGSVLWDVESYVDSRYHFVAN